ncbi:VOC family protein [bacterium]|nr:VOC family protein [bacterium]
MPRITHIELNSAIPESLGSFYSKVFGWIFQKKQTGNENYWFLFTGMGASEAGINAGIKPQSTPKLQWVPTIHVDGIDAALKKIVDNGGKITHPKRAVTSTGYLAYCEDPEGNLFGILEKDSSVE